VLATAAWCLQPAPGTWRRQFVLGLAWGAAFLIKFNSLALAPICLVGAFAAAPRWRRAAAFAAGVALIVGAFLVTFHRPTVGTWSLNLGVGWHRMCNLDALEVDVDAAAGPQTRLGHVLLLDLPHVAPGEFAFRHVRIVPRHERKPYLDRWQQLLDMPDARAIDACYRAAAIPEGGAPDLRQPDSFYRLYHLLGLHRAERLLNAIWWENVCHAPGRYVRGLAARLLDGAHFARHYQPYLPLLPVESPERGGFAPVLHLGNSTQELVDVEVSRHCRPGPARLLGSLALLPRVPMVLLWLLLLAGAVRHALALARRRGRAPVSWFALGTWCSLLGLLVFSALTLSFRVKELVAALPLVALGVAVLFRAPAPPLAAEPGESARTPAPP
jgi:hypothetical protein